MTLAVGMVIGLLIGRVEFPAFGAKVGLGNAGGLLVSGILVSSLQSRLRFFGNTPNAARNILEDLGLVVFVAIVGINAGNSLLSQLSGMLALKIFDALPGTGVSAPLRRLATRNTTDRLQLIRPAAQDDSLDLYATVRISSHEASSGAGKMVSIPAGFRKRLLRVRVPPRVTEGSLLRLRGLGNLGSDGRRGDLLLRIAILDPPEWGVAGAR